MSVFVPVSTYITYGKISKGLAADDFDMQRMRGKKLPKNRAALIEIMTDAIEWRNSIDPTDETLNATCLYLYSLCYVTEAQKIINAGTTGNLINPSTGQNVTLTPLLLQFVIGEGGSLMNAGDTALVLSYANIITNSLSVDADGTEVAKNRNDRFSFTDIYTVNNATITFNQAVQTGQLIMIHGLILTPV